MLGNGSVPQHHQKKRFTLSSVEMATFHSACVWLHECSAMARCRNTTKKTIHLFIFVFLKNVVFGSMNARQWLGSETPPNRQFKPSVLSQVFRFVWLHACSATARCRNTTKKTIHTFIFVFLKSVSLCLAPWMLGNSSGPKHFTEQTIHAFTYDARSRQQTMHAFCLHAR